jgi:natural product biosynthesis luciferase-like monooxygenase protein
MVRGKVMKFGIMTLHDHYPEDCSASEYYQLLLDEIVYAEELGFDSVWVGEHHFCNYICPSPPVFLAAVAERTSRIRIGTSVALLPLHDPIRLAEDYAMLDMLSNGRLDLGVSRGFQKTGYDGFQIPMEESRARFTESIELIDKCWSDNNVTHAGQFRQIENLRVMPRPVQQPRPPIWIGAGPTPESYVFAGERGYDLMLASVLAPIEAFAFFMPSYRETLKASGYDPDKARVLAGNHCYVGTSKAQAMDLWEKYYLRYMHFIDTLISERDYEGQTQFKAFEDAKQFFSSVQFEEVTHTIAVCGDAEEVSDRVAKAQELVGCTDYFIMADIGGLPREELWASLRRFAEEVIPKFC